MYSVVFGIAVGVAMIGQWSFLLATGRIPELVDEPVRIRFHIAAEVATALCLIVGGLGVVAGADWGRPAYLVAVGMLVYTAIVSPGYFAEKGQWAWLGVFAVVLGGALASILPIV